VTFKLKLFIKYPTYNGIQATSKNPRPEQTEKNGFPTDYLSFFGAQPSLIVNPDNWQYMLAKIKERLELK